eukprot:g1740.t1
MELTMASAQQPTAGPAFASSSLRRSSRSTRSEKTYVGLDQEEQPSKHTGDHLTQLRVALKAITPPPPPKDLSSVFEEIAQQAQEQFELGGGEQTPKRPPISIPSDSELRLLLANVSCAKTQESQVKPRAMMLRRRRIAKAKAIVGQLLGEAHGFTDAEVEEFTLQYMNLSEQLVFKPGDDQQAKITTQTLLHMDCNVMSGQRVTNLLRASQHPG